MVCLPSTHLDRPITSNSSNSLPPLLLSLPPPVLRGSGAEAAAAATCQSTLRPSVPIHPRFLPLQLPDQQRCAHCSRSTPVPLPVFTPLAPDDPSAIPQLPAPTTGPSLLEARRRPLHQARHRVHLPPRSAACHRPFPPRSAAHRRPLPPGSAARRRPLTLA
ncbi:hypothetical protein GQ55_1G170800 [Panicum hallii var. hallii]|uniref:Uncharacterized protein n=1 Tax=Panicum hallii var. hallii TaxID=1504633 RepID=A0A2T7F5U6_9POAL|nr:hypothetical protein GQ55_1G170800 [Panicum hallii var. hallii]